MRKILCEKKFFQKLSLLCAITEFKWLDINSIAHQPPVIKNFVKKKCTYYFKKKLALFKFKRLHLKSKQIASIIPFQQSKIIYNCRHLKCKCYPTSVTKYLEDISMYVCHICIARTLAFNLIFIKQTASTCRS